MASAEGLQMEVKNHGVWGTAIDGALWSDFLPCPWGMKIEN
jgi:hypothetical protein